MGGLRVPPCSSPADERIILEEERHLYQGRREGDHRQSWDSPRRWDPPELEDFFQREGRYPTHEEEMPWAAEEEDDWDYDNEDDYDEDGDELYI